MRLSHIGFLDMRPLISPKNRSVFEKVRRTLVFYDSIKNDIPSILCPLVFRQTSLREEKLIVPRNITPLFNSLDINCPLYKLNKAEVSFPNAIQSNFTFKTQFMRLWNSFDISLFISVNGWIILFFSKEITNSNPIKIAQTQLRFQETVDVPSDIRW